MANEQNRIILNMPQVKYMELYENYSLGKVELNDIYRYMTFNVKPSTDNKPFFFDTNKFVPLDLLMLLLLLSSIVNFIYQNLKRSQVYQSSIYFGLIGVGFMLIEIPIIQKSLLFLGNPTKSFSYVLFSLLLSCGIGSYLSNRKIFDFKIKDRKIIFLVIPILILLLQISFPILFDRFRGIGEIYKLLMITGLLFPLGFFLGMAFPKGISSLALNNQEQHISLIWGVNGVMSVMGSVLATIVSMKLGFNAANLLGGLMYLSIFIFKY